MSWLAVHFPQLALELAIKQHPDVHAQDPSLVVLENGRVCQRSPAAAAQGIIEGTTLATAHSIAPGLAHAERDPVLEQSRLRQLADLLYSFSSRVAIQPPDCVLLETGGSRKLFGPGLPDQVLQTCAQAGHRAVCRTAPTPWAAVALARAGHQDIDTVPLTLAGLDLAGLPDNLTERLANMGIYTLGQLLNLPVRQLGKRFGKSLTRYLRQLKGELPDPRCAITPAPDFDQALHFLSPATSKAELSEGPQSPMQTLARDLQAWLIAHQLGCEKLVWVFFGQDTSATAEARFAQPRQSASDFLGITLLRLERTELPGEVTGVKLSAGQIAPWHDHAMGLFQDLADAPCNPDDASRTGSSAAGALVDELCARLGDDACRGISPSAQHAPEQAHRTLAIHATRVVPAPLPVPYTPRPLWLLPAPRRISRRSLTLLYGPERIQSNWWQATVARDYYVVQDHEGSQCWAFVDDGSQWYLHGYFA